MDFGAEFTGAVPIGRGSSATVYRARSVTFDRDVAIKVFHGGVDDEGLRRTFSHECAVLGSLADHPHVVAVHDCGFTRDGHPFLVMAYCDRGSLAGVGSRGQLLDEGDVAVVGLAVADALQAAHDRDILHRDVKPHNILSNSYGVVALADFGIAVRNLGELTSAATTLTYAAPEVLLDQAAAAPVSDVYGLAATLYALLTGGPPIPPEPGETQLHYLQRVRDAPVPALPATVAQPLAQVILAGLAKDPANRPPTAAAFAQRLKAAAEQAGITIPNRLTATPIPANPPPAGIGPHRPGSPSPDADDTTTPSDPARASPSARWPLHTAITPAHQVDPTHDLPDSELCDTIIRPPKVPPPRESERPRRRRLVAVAAAAVLLTCGGSVAVIRQVFATSAKTGVAAATPGTRTHQPGPGHPPTPTLSTAGPRTQEPTITPTAPATNTPATTPAFSSAAPATRASRPVAPPPQPAPPPATRIALSNSVAVGIGRCQLLVDYTAVGEGSPGHFHDTTITVRVTGADVRISTLFESQDVSSGENPKVVQPVPGAIYHANQIGSWSSADDFANTYAISPGTPAGSYVQLDCIEDHLGVTYTGHVRWDFTQRSWSVS
jgi:serine/threonine protein kinase